MPYPKYWSQAKQQQEHTASLYIFKPKILSGLTNKLVCLRNANNLLTVNFEHSGRVLSAKHLSLYSAMVFTNISTSSKDASWIYWANAMMVLQQSTQSTQWWPAEFPVMSNQNLIGTPTCWLTLENYQNVKSLSFYNFLTIQLLHLNFSLILYSLFNGLYLINILALIILEGVR